MYTWDLRTWVKYHTNESCHTSHHTWVKSHCNTLQHTATHCNTLQHTATHCSTLQHTATHCNTPQHTASLQIIHITRQSSHTPTSHFTRMSESRSCCEGLLKIILHTWMIIHIMMWRHDTYEWVVSSMNGSRHTYEWVMYLRGRLVWCNVSTHGSCCYTLQHTATHCNTLQHTATHCNTLQYTAKHRNTLQHTASLPAW